MDLMRTIHPYGVQNTLYGYGYILLLMEYAGGCFSEGCSRQSIATSNLLRLRLMKPCSRK